MPDSEPVRMWRDFARLNLSKSWKADVDKTIKNLALWEEILSNWYYIKAGKKIRKAPGIKNLLTEYESREREQLEANERIKNAATLSACSRPWLSERDRSGMREVQRETERVYFRGDQVDEYRLR